jgi:predicted methyltransferase
MKESWEYLNQRYAELIDPINFIKLFKTTDEFIEWAQLGTAEDLICTIAEFEKAELYEYCDILRQVHDSLINKQ